MHKKPHLPTKICAACGRPFAWRKKWERDWEHVKFCSDRCRSAGKGLVSDATAIPPISPMTGRRR
ncbi:DUF2256 domain-containing protein [Novosphingobium sp. P6W]|uniref:DUF2256 domain-containing protein n=1 Tax=Novosphingobium sp. P6W TaxID=1609758 RepID=UPI0009E50FB3|nr:DUF2256 domain-containing protein [Novosphingobium sp. P6W]